MPAGNVFDTLVKECLGLQPNCYFHATSHDESVSESDSVHKIHSLKPKG